MESKENNVLPAFSVLQGAPLQREIVIPLDIILHLGDFLRFEDYRNFVKSIWPANDECDAVRNKLWQRSTHKIAIEFFNEEILNIEYNFDASRTKDQQFLFNVETLSPVFGGVVPPGTNQFLSASKLENFLRMHVHLNMCSRRQFAACSCHELKCGTYTGVKIVKPPKVACRYGHFHHFCSQHVRDWVDIFLMSAVVKKEEGSPSDADMTKRLLAYMRDSVRLSGC
ncbi:Rep2 [Hyposoter didymator ichnovirus]|nr:repeat element protein [Hyposoter didymator ichnovirus]AAO16962.1 repeat element protein [Hyposoter didymator ichnovirus]AIK25672.1 Rep2 [Hyposoter didymator ichnovirus]AIK25677.1 Rep2 [Hyposoter didymator ichnovirus]